MNRGYTGRIVITLATIVLSLWFLYPSYQWYSIPHDLRLKNLTPRLVELQEELANEQSTERKGQLLQDIQKEKDWIKSVSGRAISLGLDLSGGAHLVLQVHGDVESETMEQSGQSMSQQVITVLRLRIDGLGVRESVIAGLEKGRILVEVPNTDPETLKELIQKTALLSFHMEMKPETFQTWFAETDKELGTGLLGERVRTDQESGDLRIAEADLSSVSATVFSPGFTSKLDRGHHLVFSQRQQDQTGGAEYRTLHCVKKQKEVGGDRIESAVAYPDPSQGGEWVVSITFDNQGRKQFANTTEKGVNERMAIVLDGFVVSDPVIREPIKYGAAQISGGRMTYESARNLAVSLNAGALPAAIEIVEDRSVSPSLGVDSINKGSTATMVALLIVLLFMAIYYFVSGAIANISLLLNLLILLACLALAHATLTLPGIAGVVLLIGMAVDAAVLIYERIREELASRAERKSIAMIIDKGYDKAFSTIFDANVTTLITAFVLLTFGTGPVKGFAVTLIFGILISLYTSLFVSRLLMDLWYIRRRRERINIGTMHWLSNLKTDIFTRKRKLWFTLSGSAIALSLILIFTVGLNKGIDFTGGTRLEVRVPGQSMEDIRRTVGELGLGQDLEIQSAVNEPELFSIKVAGNKKIDTAVVRDTMGRALGEQLERFADTVPAQFQEYEEESGKTFAHFHVAPGVSRDDVDTALSRAGFEGSMIASASDEPNLFAVGLNNADFIVQQLGVSRSAVQSVDEVGPSIGHELVYKAIMSIVYSCFFIILYVWVRFQFSFGLAAVVALLHDVIFTLGVFSLCKLLGFQREVTLPVVAAYLTIVGYSLNDTIVVFDRIRENMQTGRGRIDEIINTSICQTMSRTILTSSTTLMTVLVLFLFGGAVINDFAFALLVGIGVGTYSSVFLASPLLVVWAEYWQKRTEQKNPQMGRSRSRAKART